MGPRKSPKSQATKADSRALPRRVPGFLGLFALGAAPKRGRAEAALTEEQKMAILQEGMGR